MLAVQSQVRVGTAAGYPMLFIATYADVIKTKPLKSALINELTFTMEQLTVCFK